VEALGRKVMSMVAINEMKDIASTKLMGQMRLWTFARASGLSCTF